MISHLLHGCPHPWQVVGAPTIEFMHSNNDNLCVLNSLASALVNNVNFHEEAEEVVSRFFGKREIAGETVVYAAINKVVNYS